METLARTSREVRALSFLFFCKEISYTIQVKAKKMSQTKTNVQIDIMVVNTLVKLSKAQSRRYQQKGLREEGQLQTS